MTDDTTTTDSAEVEPYVVLNTYENLIEFYAEIEATSHEDAITSAIKANDDEDLLPIADGENAANPEKGFIAVRKSEWNFYTHR